MSKYLLIILDMFLPYEISKVAWESRYRAENPPLYSSLDHNIGCFHHFYLKTYQHSVGLLDTNVSLDKWLYFACFLMLTLVGNRQKNQLWNWSLIPLLSNTVYTIAGNNVSKQTKSHTYLSGLVSYAREFSFGKLDELAIWSDCQISRKSH